MRRKGSWKAAAAATLLASVASAGLAGSAGGARAPAAGSVAPEAPYAQAGGRLEVVASGRGRTALLLSRDRRRSRDDVKLGARRLRARRTRLRFAVPRRTRLGAYHVLACPPRPARCRASRRRVAVTGRPRPARIAPSPDPARAATAAIGRDGGTVSATGADGTTYTLAIPAGALLDPTAVTVTPVAPGRMPLRARAARAVQIAPAGRDLLKPATLTVAGRSAPGRPTLTGFGFDANGREFHLTAAKAEPGRATLPVFELKGHGIAAATAAARYAFSRARLPTALPLQLEQVAAVPRRPRGARAAAAGPSDDLGTMIVANAHAIAATAAADVDAAVAQYVPWDAIAAAHPLAPALRTGVVAGGFRAALVKEIATATGLCTAAKDIAQLGRLLRYRDYLYAALATLPIQDLRGGIDGALDRCLRFELDYDVSISGQNGYQEAVSAHVRAKPAIRMQAAGQTSSFAGSSPLEVAGYSVGPAGCYTHTWNVTPKDPLVVREMAVDIQRLRGAERAPPSIRVRFNLGSLDEQVTHTCSDGGESYTDQQHAYDGVAAALLGGAAGSDFTLHWVGGGAGGSYAGQTFTRQTSADGGSYTGAFSFTLRHTPG